jgi:Fic family protein|nr:Fic family protein [uncultured Lachnoclostridium sp.]
MINYISNKTLSIRAKKGDENAETELMLRQMYQEKIGLKGINDEDLVYVTFIVNPQIERLKELYTQVTLNEQAYQENIVLDSFHSATIEGARTTVDNVVKAMKEKPKTKDDKMVVNSINGYYYALNNHYTIDNLLELWKIVTEDVCDNQDKVGSRFRTGMVYIGNETETIHTPEIPEKLEERMASLYKYIDNAINHSDEDNVILAAIVYHFYFVYIHPFADGNGRTSRIMMASIMHHEGYDKVGALPISRCINDRLSRYYNSLEESEIVRKEGKNKYIDITPFLAEMLDILELAMLSALASQNGLTKNESMLLIKMKKHKGAEITIEKCASILEITKANASRLLQGMVDKGYLEKVDNVYKPKV